MSQNTVGNSIFSNTEDDPRYTFQENSNEEKQNYNYSCTLIPFEKLENAYRIVNIELTKQKDNKKKTKTFL